MGGYEREISGKPNLTFRPEHRDTTEEALARLYPARLGPCLAKIQDSKDWVTIERPGYFGKKRDELIVRWNKEHGEGNWRLVWNFGDNFLDRTASLRVYEDAYYEFLKVNPQILEWLVNTASNVYDTAPSNVRAGLSYDVQETPNAHLHNIAIRWAVLRNGESFRGNQVMQVRGPGTEGERLSPYLVPFHKPELILPDAGDVKDYGYKGKWWRKLGIPLSVEEFYQHNKQLQVRK